MALTSGSSTSDFQTQEEIRGKDNAEKELVQKDVKEQRRGGKDPIQALFLFVGTQWLARGLSGIRPSYKNRWNTIQGLSLESLS